MVGIMFFLSEMILALHKQFVVTSVTHSKRKIRLTTNILLMLHDNRRILGLLIPVLAWKIDAGRVENFGILPDSRVPIAVTKL